jgi:hypothetical protein
MSCRPAALEQPGGQDWVGLRQPTNRIHRRKAGVEGSMPVSCRSPTSRFDPLLSFATLTCVTAMQRLLPVATTP